MEGALAIQFSETQETDGFFDALETNRRNLYRVARRALGSREAAEDLVQETLFCALRSRRHYDTGRPLGSWLYGILHNQLKNHYARRSRDLDLMEKAQEIRLHQEPSRVADPESFAMDQSETSELRRALGSLPPKLAEPLKLYYFRGCDVRGLAAALEISEENAKVRLHRGRQALRDILTG
jgi:RNA polymerase sigma-70 factor (ECF subfamily)